MEELKSEIESFLYEGGFSVDKNEYDANYKDFYIKDNKIYCLKDRVRFRIFGKNLVPFIKKGDKYWFLKGEARKIALTLKASLSYKEAELVFENNQIQVFLQEEPKRYILFSRGLVILVTKSKKELMKYLEYFKPKTEKQNKTLQFVFEGNIYSNQEPEMFEEKAEELEEFLSLVNYLKSRKLSFEERELLKEIQSEIEFLI